MSPKAARYSAGLALLVAIGFGCAAKQPTNTPPGYVDVSEGGIGPGGGTYSYAGVSPTIIVTVPRGWKNFHHEDRFWDVARETEHGLVALFFQRPTTVYGPPEGGRPNTPREAVDLVTQNPGLTVSEPEPITVDGYEGQRVDVSAAEEDTQILAAERPLLGIGPTDDLRLAFFAVEDGILVIGYISPAGRMAETAETLQPLLATVRIEEGS
jgi:hypothetical protein